MIFHWVGVGRGHGHAAEAAVSGGRDAGRDRSGGRGRKGAAAAAGAFESAATTAKPALPIIATTTDQTIGTAVNDNNDETPLRGAGRAGLLQGRDHELGQGTDSFQHQLHRVQYHTGPHRDGGGEVDEEGRPFGESERTETANQ